MNPKLIGSLRKVRSAIWKVLRRSTAALTTLALSAAGNVRAETPIVAVPTPTPVACVANLDPWQVFFGDAGGSGCFDVIAPDDCCWQAIGQYVTSGANGCGDGSVCYNVPPGWDHPWSFQDITVGTLHFWISFYNGPGGTMTVGAIWTQTARALTPTDTSLDTPTLPPTPPPTDTTIATPAPTDTPTATPPPTWTATCVPTVYCSDHCPPLTPVPACSCIENPTCKPTTLAGSTPTPLACIGDCDGNMQTTVDEIVTMVSIALGTESLDACVAGDRDQDGEITVDEIVTAVRLALDGCCSDAQSSKAPCGGTSANQCGVCEFCDYPVGTCGSGAEPGMCTVVGSGICLAYYAPICGCDGQTYSNDCFRLSAGTSKAYDGFCATPTAIPTATP